MFPSANERTSSTTGGSGRMRRRAGAIGVVLVLASCSSASDEPSGTDTPSGTQAASGTQAPPSSDDRSLGERALDAVRFGQPGELLDAATPGSVLERTGGLLAGSVDLATGYVDGQLWCDRLASNCIEVGGDEALVFDGHPLEEFELSAQHEVSGDDDLEVVGVYAFHHPVSNRLRLAIDVEPSEFAWSSLYDTAELKIGGADVPVYLDGPEVAVPGVVSRYFLAGVDADLTGVATLDIRFSDGITDGKFVEIKVDVATTGPEVVRTETALDANPPSEVFRWDTALPAVDDEAGALETLIDALAGDQDSTDLVVPNSPAATAIEAIVGVDQTATPRSDPDNPTGLCWQVPLRGTFCERWHSPEVVDGQLSSWSVEGVPLSELVETRDGSLPGSTSTWLRLPVGRVIVGAVAVRNDSVNALGASLYAPTVVDDGIASAALLADGGYSVEPGTTESATLVLSSDDFEFDVWYPLGYDLENEPLRFSAGAPARDASSDDLTASSVRLASLLRANRFDEAVSEAAPGTPAAAYLEGFAATVPDASFFVSGDRDGAGSTEVCADSLDDVVCSGFDVTALDESGLITEFTIDGVSVEDLVVVDRSNETDGFAVSIERAVLWPRVALLVSWEIRNDSIAEVIVESVTLVDRDGVLTESDRSLYEPLPVSRTVTGVSTFPVDALGGVLEFRATGRDEVRDVVLVVSLRESDIGAESSVEFEAGTTEFETRGGTILTIPGAWDQIVYFDDETSELVGTGMSLGPPKAIARDDLILLAFSPAGSPDEMATDDLVAQLSELLDLSEVELFPATSSSGQAISLIAADSDFTESRSVIFAIPGPDDVVVILVPAVGPRDASLLADTLQALQQQLGVQLQD